MADVTWRDASPGTLRRMAAAQRETAAMYQRWADDREHQAAVYEDLAAEKERA